MRPPKPANLYSFFWFEVTAPPSQKKVGTQTMLPKLRMSLSPLTRPPSPLRKYRFQTLKIQAHVVGLDDRYPGIG